MSRRLIKKVSKFKLNKRSGIAIGIVILFVAILLLRYADVIDLTVEPLQWQDVDEQIISIGDLTADEKAALSDMISAGTTPMTLDIYHCPFGTSDGYGMDPTYKQYHGGTPSLNSLEWTLFTASERSQSLQCALHGYMFGDSLDYILSVDPPRISYDEVSLFCYQSNPRLYALGNPGVIPNFWDSYNANPPAYDEVYEFLYAYKSTSEANSEEGLYPACYYNYYGGGLTISDYSSGSWTNRLDLNLRSGPGNPGLTCGTDLFGKHVKYAYGPRLNGMGQWSANSILLWKPAVVDGITLSSVSNPQYVLLTGDGGTQITFGGGESCEDVGPIYYNGYRYECINPSSGTIKKTKVEVILDVPIESPYGSPFKVGAYLSGFDTCQVTVNVKRLNGDIIQSQGPITSSPSNRYVDMNPVYEEGNLIIEVIAEKDGYSDTQTQNVEFITPVLDVSVPSSNIPFGTDFDISCSMTGQTGVTLNVWLNNSAGVSFFMGQYVKDSPTTITIHDPDIMGNGKVYVEASKGQWFDNKEKSITFTEPVTTVTTSPSKKLYKIPFSASISSPGLENIVAEAQLYTSNGVKVGTPKTGNSGSSDICVINGINPAMTGSGYLEFEVTVNGQPLDIDNKVVYIETPDLSLYIPSKNNLHYMGDFHVDCSLDSEYGGTNFPVEARLRNTQGDQVGPVYTGNTLTGIEITDPILGGSGSLEVTCSVYDLEVMETETGLYFSPPSIQVIPENNGDLSYKDGFEVFVKLGDDDEFQDLSVSKGVVKDGTGTTLGNMISGKTYPGVVKFPGIAFEGQVTIEIEVLLSGFSEPLSGSASARIWGLKLNWNPGNDFSYGIDFDVFAELEGYPTAEFVVEIYDGKDLQGTRRVREPLSGYAPSPIEINNPPLKGLASIRIIAYVNGNKYIEDYKNVDFQYSSPMTVDWTGPLKYGQSFWITVGNVPDSKKTVEIYRGDEIIPSMFYARYYGSQSSPLVHIEDSSGSGPKISGDAVMVVFAEYPTSGITYQENFSLRFTPPDITVDWPTPSELIAGNSFDLEIITQGVSVPVKAYLYNKNGEEVNNWEGTSPILECSSPQLVGEGTLEVLIQWDNDWLPPYTKSVFFTGSPIKLETRVDNFIQYATEPIKFRVELTNLVTGEYVSPSDLDYYEFSSEIEKGTVSSITSTPLGDGLYQIVVLLKSGSTGELSTILNYGYEGVSYESQPVIIQIDPTSISINTNEVSPVTTLGKTERLKITVYDSLGNKLDPDSLECLVKLPTTTVDLVTKGDFERTEKGVYYLTYTFTEVEHYTFEFTATASGMDTGFATAGVTSNTESGTGGQTLPGPDWAGFFINYWWIIIVAFAILVVAIWRFLI